MKTKWQNERRAKREASRKTKESCTPKTWASKDIFADSSLCEWIATSSKIRLRIFVKNHLCISRLLREK